MTKPVTRKMVVDWFVENFIVECEICGVRLRAPDDIEWDHHHADVFDGPHVWDNLRPLHAFCHRKKTARDIKDNAKVKRIQRGKKPSKHKMPSRPFPTGQRKMQSRPFTKRKP